MNMGFGRALIFIPSSLQVYISIFLDDEENILFQYLIGRSNISAQIIIDNSTRRNQKTIPLPLPDLQNILRPMIPILYLGNDIFDLSHDLYVNIPSAN